MGIETVMTIEEMEYDKVNPAVFELPADVKALAEKPAEKPAGKADGPKALQKKEQVGK
mgnify:CR=1 FL=1